MIAVKEVIIVEGKYDKIKLSSFVRGMIVETRGFRIFKDKEQMALLRKLADTRGLLILTDSDSAGFVIRNYLQGCIPAQQIKHAYIPDIFGKEPRKNAYSKEGKLGVEGMEKEVLLGVLYAAGVTVESGEMPKKNTAGQISRQTFYELGFFGTDHSAQKRKRLLKQLKLPEHLSVSAMIDAVNSLVSYEEFCCLAEEYSIREGNDDAQDI